MRGEHRQAGYTLIEVLIVTVVLAIVVGIALSSVTNALDKAKQRATMADMRTISKAIEVYQTDHGFVPDDSGGLALLREVLIPYQSSVVPVDDHWGHAYGYSSEAAAGNYTLESYGKDGLDGDDITLATRRDFNRDIVLANGQFLAAPE